MNKKTCGCCGAPLPPRRRRYCSDQCMRHETNARRRVGAPKRKIQEEQLCWTCAKACGGCSWSRAFVPVEGWEAKQSKTRADGYRIVRCPEYESDLDEYERKM